HGQGRQQQGRQDEDAGNTHTVGHLKLPSCGASANEDGGKVSPFNALETERRAISTVAQKVTIAVKAIGLSPQTRSLEHFRASL
ncbi:hypothetical protein, partial [Klebsiella pneumoniae]|uniref:hypothetical protein n=1 Tax=Klebsiella pneumoniae TaxID=573 RepID=UPI001D0EB273